MYRNILVPLDGSTFAERVLPMAASIARRNDGNLRLAHIRPILLLENELAGVDAELKAWEKSYLTNVAARVLDGYGIDATSTTRDGDVVQQLLACADECAADLVVLATHGRGGLSRAWLGSVADGMVRNSSIPVLAVRAGEGEEAPRQMPVFRHVLIPLDGSPRAEQVIRHATQLAAEDGARLTLVQVVIPEILVDPISGGHSMHAEKIGLQRRVEEARAYLDEIANRLRAQGHRVATEVIAHGNPATGILDYAAGHEVDLIATSTHGRGGLRRLVLGSVADKLLRAAETPVLLHRPVEL